MYPIRLKSLLNTYSAHTLSSRTFGECNALFIAIDLSISLHVMKPF